MGATPTWTMHCDRCDATLETVIGGQTCEAVAASKSRIVAKALGDGWRVDAEVCWLCPDCQAPARAVAKLWAVQ